MNGVDFPISFMSELVRQPDSWSLQPSPSRWRDGYYSLCAFIWLFLLVVTFVVSWSFMRGMEAKWSWFITALISTPVVTLFGFTFCCIVESVYQPLRNLSRRLTIPDDGGDLVFFTPGPDQPSRATRRRSASASEAKLAGQSQVLIRSDLIAVQLSPWYLEDNSDGDLEICHIVQGNLVFQKSTGSPINRLNIYCADDLVKGARVMKQLADILQVPFLFDADHQGWKLAIKQGRERGQTPRPRRFRSNLPSPSKGSGHQPRS